jgi:hypothetical protein
MLVEGHSFDNWGFRESHSSRCVYTSGFPKDGFFASGDRGQRIYIIPSEHLVTLRHRTLLWTGDSFSGSQLRQH